MNFTRKIFSVVVVGFVALSSFAAYAGEFPIPCVVVPGEFNTAYGKNVEYGTFAVIGYALAASGQVVTSNLGPNYGSEVDAQNALSNAKTAGICKL